MAGEVSVAVSAFVTWLARNLAVLGGMVLVLITLITVASIVGRGFIWAGLRPVPGDFELVEAGVGFAVFAFLPWCQLNRGHATVDVFTSFLSDRANRIIDLVSETVLTGVMVLIAWRLWHGMQDKIRYSETTFILQFPVWWAYAACMAAACIAVVVSFYMVWVRVRELGSERPRIDAGQGGFH
jgi:TRAP-type C4-dicarboxylate transport system permease small subunit